MTPVRFPQVNAFFGAPAGLDENQVVTVPAFAGSARGGSLDGMPIVVTAWQPSPAELAALNAGRPIFLTFIGGLPPHMATTDFESATQSR